MHSSGCENPSWQGDGYCDDENNNNGCDFDGGDCCGDDVKTTYCTVCDCLEGPPPTNPPPPPEEGMNSSKYPN